jgi:excisionase family DNA binding protein
MSNQIVILTTDEYRRHLTEAAELGARLAFERTKHHAGAWSVDECAAYLSVSSRVIYELANRGEIPHFRVGVQIRFHPAEVMNWRGVSGMDSADKIVEMEVEAKRRKSIK